jgi:hypothetical protein
METREPQPPATDQPQDNRGRRLLRLALWTVTITVFVSLVVFPVLFGFVRTWAIIHPPCADTGQTPNDWRIRYTDVALPMRDGTTLNGFFVPGAADNDTLILVPPPYSAGRNGMLTETISLAKRGYSLLLWESRACRGQPTSLGYTEMLDIGDVISYVRKTPNLPQGKIALHGFSAAGAASTMAAARYPEVAALLTEGGYHRWDAVTGLSYGNGWLEWLVGVGGNVAYRLTTGLDGRLLDPIGAIPQIVPRPIYFVYGEIEPSLNGAREQLAVALQKQPDTFAVLWVVPRADHSTYLADAGPEYEKRTGLFYDCALRGQGCDEFWQVSGRSP